MLFYILDSSEGRKNKRKYNVMERLADVLCNESPNVVLPLPPEPNGCFFNFNGI